MTAVLLGINENRLAHFKAERASILFFSPSWVAHTYLQGPQRSIQHPHSALHTVAAITTLVLMGCSWCDPSEQQHDQHRLNYCHWLSVTERWQVGRNSGSKVARAQQKIIRILHWKGAGNRNLDAAAWGHKARGSERGWLFPTTVQPICQNICHFPLPLCNCNPKLINKLGIMNINKKNRKPVAKRYLVQPKYFSCCRELAQETNILLKETM